MWLASSPPLDCVTSTASGWSRTSPWRTSMRDSSKCFGTYTRGCGSARQCDGRSAHDRAGARLGLAGELDVDEFPARLLALPGDLAGAGDAVLRPGDRPELHVEGLDRAGSGPVDHDVREQTHREHAVREHRGHPGLLGDRLVVVHRVVVAGRARILD